MTDNGATRDVIKVEGLHKTYHLGEVKVRALNGVSVTIRYADFLIITGRNGSGKSTLLHQLGLLDEPDAGSIVLNGEDTHTMSPRRRGEIRLSEIGYIFQEFALVAGLTAIENVMLPSMMLEPPSVCRPRAKMLLESLEPRQLSGGEQQKVAIARALMNDPSVIFADEPTANLDLVSAGEVLDIFERLNKEEKHTIVMVTHEFEETAIGNRLITLSDGKIAYEE
jgi:putative ABC transport system ATP-binding protein